MSYPPAISTSRSVYRSYRSQHDCVFCDRLIRRYGSLEVRPLSNYLYEPYWAQEFSSKKRGGSLHFVIQGNAWSEICGRCINKMRTDPRIRSNRHLIDKLVSAIYPVLISIEEQDMQIQAENRRKIERLACMVVKEFTK